MYLLIYLGGFLSAGGLILGISLYDYLHDHRYLRPRTIVFCMLGWPGALDE